jgi:hypothetical protein
LITKILEIAKRWRVRCIGFESILFARTTQYYLEQQMMINKAYYRIEAIEDKRAKSIRIRDGLTDLAFNGRLHFHKNQTSLHSEFLSYPDTEHDDGLDALSIALMCRSNSDIIEGEWEEVIDPEEMALLEDWRGCPSAGYY